MTGKLLTSLSVRSSLYWAKAYILLSISLALDTELIYLATNHFTNNSTVALCCVQIFFNIGPSWPRPISNKASLKFIILVKN